MATQNFKAYKYTDDEGNNRRIRASTKVAAAQTTAATAAQAGMKPSVKVGRGNREFGIRSRFLRLQRTAGTAPDIKTYYDKLPIFLAADVVTMKALQTVTLDGVAWTVTDYVAEDYN